MWVIVHFKSSMGISMLPGAEGSAPQSKIKVKTRLDTFASKN